jgi:hypothetical protein
VERVRIRWDVTHPKYKGGVVEAVLKLDVAKVYEGRGMLEILGPVGAPAEATAEAEGEGGEEQKPAKARGGKSKGRDE